MTPILWLVAFALAVLWENRTPLGARCGAQPTSAGRWPGPPRNWSAAENWSGGAVADADEIEFKVQA